MPVTLPDPQLPGDPRDALQSIQRNFEALSLLSPLPLPVGTVLPYAASSSPDGFRACDGTSLLKADYPALFEVIGYTYGGQGASFNLPDLQGRMPVGRAGVGGNAAVTVLGLNDGTALANRQPAHPHSATLNNNTTGISIPSGGSHSHTASDGGHTHNVQVNYAQASNTGTSGSGNRSSLQGTGWSTTYGSGWGYANITVHTTNSSHSHTITDPGHGHTIAVGTAGGTNNAPSYIVLSFIIKT